MNSEPSPKHISVICILILSSLLRQVLLSASFLQFSELGLSKQSYIKFCKFNEFTVRNF